MGSRLRLHSRTARPSQPLPPRCIACGRWLAWVPTAAALHRIQQPVSQLSIASEPPSSFSTPFKCASLTHATKPVVVLS